MKIYDTHSDVFSNLYERHLQGEHDIFKTYHEQNLKQGEVVGGIFVVYSSKEFDVEKALEIALKEYLPFKEQYDVVIGLEGLRNVTDITMLKRLYDQGVRHAMLTWNEENHLATGINGDPSKGVTPLGYKFLDFMEANKMIVDVSHLNVQSFYDVMNYVKRPVIASHSCCYSLNEHKRNLNDDQLKVLKETKSYVGVNSARNHVCKMPCGQTIKGLCDHIDYLVKHLDIDHVMLGLDMMDYLIEYGNINNPNKRNDNLDDLKTHADCQNIISELKYRHYCEEDIEKICYKNYLNMRKELLGY